MKKASKLSKIRTLKCVICHNIFERHISPSEIKSGRGKACSKICKNILNGRLKKKGRDRECKRCKKIFHTSPSENAKYCSRKCWNPTERGKALSIDGYYVIAGRKLHRIIMEEYIGRKLKSTEIVHHINHDKLDNRIENLQIVSRSEHNKIHKFFVRKRR